MRVFFVCREPLNSSIAVATLTCEEEVKGFDCCVLEDDDVRVTVVGQDGGLFLYQFSLASLPESALSPRFTVQYVTSPAKV